MTPPARLQAEVAALIKSSGEDGAEKAATTLGLTAETVCRIALGQDVRPVSINIATDRLARRAAKAR